MDFYESDFVSTKWGLSVMFLLLGVFHITNRVIKHHCIPKCVKIKGESEVWKWSNLLMSWIHALIIGSWDLLCFYYYPELMDDLINFKNTFSFYMVVFSTGYFIYDFGDVIYNNKMFKMWELTLHHIAVISIFIYHLFAITCIGYNVVALLFEVSSFFLHSRKLLQMLDISFTNPFYLFVAVINLTAFVTFRGYSLVRISYGMYAEKNLFSQTYYITLCFSMFIMNMLNPILFWILIKNDFIRNFRQQRRRDKASNGNLHNTHANAYSKHDSIGANYCHRSSSGHEVDDHKMD